MPHIIISDCPALGRGVMHAGSLYLQSTAFYCKRCGVYVFNRITWDGKELPGILCRCNFKGGNLFMPEEHEPEQQAASPIRGVTRKQALNVGKELGDFIVLLLDDIKNREQLTDFFKEGMDMTKIASLPISETDKQALATNIVEGILGRLNTGVTAFTLNG